MRSEIEEKDKIIEELADYYSVFIFLIYSIVKKFILQKKIILTII